MKKKEFNQVSISVGSSVRNAAFAKGINRAVNFANVKKILADMREKGYRLAEVIQVIPAEDVIKDGDVTLVDLNDKPIEKEEAENYYLVLDGQHRVYAASCYNDEIEDGQLSSKIIVVPALQVELNTETISEYIAAINITKFSWKIPEFVKGAANVVETNPLLTRYNELIKCSQNSDGISLSTLNLIFCGTPKALTQTDFSLIWQRQTTKGVSKKRNIIPRYNIEKGNKFIEMCLNVGFKLGDIKRYIAEEYVSIKSCISEEHANKVFSSITSNHMAAMYNAKGNLDRDLFKIQIDMISNSIRDEENRAILATESTSETPVVSETAGNMPTPAVIGYDEPEVISKMVDTEISLESRCIIETDGLPLKQAV